jgi:hypothetical protein
MKSSPPLDEAEIQPFAARNDAFYDWWSINHPWDWWAKEFDGEPVNHKTRLLVWDLCRQAYEAGQWGK